MSPVWFIVGGVLWLVVFVFVLALCAAASRADELVGRERDVPFW